MNENIISQSGEFISASKGWATNEFVVFFTLLFVGVILLIMYYTQKHSEKINDKLLEAMGQNTKGYEKLSHSIDLQNNTSLEILNRLDKGINDSLQMHKQTHSDINDLKKIVLSRRSNDE